jgi:hypothetical protein
MDLFYGAFLFDIKRNTGDFKGAIQEIWRSYYCDIMILPKLHDAFVLLN